MRSRDGKLDLEIVDWSTICENPTKVFTLERGEYSTPENVHSSGMGYCQTHDLKGALYVIESSEQEGALDIQFEPMTATSTN